MNSITSDPTLGSLEFLQTAVEVASSAYAQLLSCAFSPHSPPRLHLLCIRCFIKNNSFVFKLRERNEIEQLQEKKRLYVQNVKK
jgi:hypothetical protein